MTNNPHERGDAPYGDAGEPRQGPWDRGPEEGPDYGPGGDYGTGEGNAHDPYAAPDGASGDIFEPVENDGSFGGNNYAGTDAGGANMPPPYAAGPHQQGQFQQGQFQSGQYQSGQYQQPGEMQAGQYQQPGGMPAGGAQYMQPHGAIPSSTTDAPQKSSPVLWIALAVCLVIIIGLGVLLLANGGDSGNTAGGNSETTSESTGGDGGTSPTGDEPVPAEYEEALEEADFLANTMNYSRNRVHDSLTSPYGDQFSEEAADYAVENVETDWRQNALQSARSYQEHLDMTPDEIYDQLTSPYGEDFTEEEAQYAVDNL